MMKKSDVAWTLVGVSAVLLSGYLLYHEVRNISLTELADSLRAIGARGWLLAALSTLGAYVALAWYDRIAMAHLGKTISWWFIALCSFTTYALAHNIGASVFSGALVRYRAYRSKGLTPQEIGILIVFCSLTFTLGTLLAAGVVLILKPQLLDRLVHSAGWVSLAIGCGLLALIALYVFGAWRQLPPWRLGKWHIQYPRLPIVGRQLLAGPLELLCGGDHLFRATGRTQSGLSHGARGVSRVLLARAAVPRTRRAWRAGADVPFGVAGGAQGRRAGGTDRLSRLLSAAAVRPGHGGRAGLRIRPVAQSTPRSADPLSRRRIGKHYDTPYRPRWSGEDASHRRSCSPLPTYPMS